MRDATRSSTSFARNWRQVHNQTLHWTGATTALVVRNWSSAPARECGSVIPTMKWLVIIIALLAGSSRACADEPTTQPGEKQTMKAKSHIPREQLQQMFDGIRQQTKWNTGGDMLWGYFFVDRGSDRLKVLRPELERQGYRFVDLHEVEKDGRHTGEFVLHVEKVETHTVDSLDIRNGELDELAAKYSVREYDGMDVGPVAPSTRPAASRPAG